MNDEEGDLFSASCSATHCMTVGGSRVRLLSMTASPARLSARSLPTTPAWPGLKTHMRRSRRLSVMQGIQSA